MSDNQQSQSGQSSGNAPIHRVRDGAVKMAIFENTSSEGRTFYNVTISRTYTDKNTGEIKETKSLRPSDLDKLFYLTTETKRMISMLNERNRDVERTAPTQDHIHSTIQEQVSGAQNPGPSHEAGQAPQAADQSASGLSAQRDAALANRATPQTSARDNVPSQTRTRSHTPEQ